MENFNKRFSDLQNFANFVGNEYVWEKTTIEYEVVTTTTGSTATGYDSAYSVKCSKNATVENGKVVLVNPVTYAYTAANKDAILSALSGGYFIFDKHSSNVRKDNGTKAESTGLYWSFYETSYISVPIVQGYVNSPDPNAYPVSDGYTYTAMGMLGEKTRIATGSYTGTGTVGRNNKNSLTFDFEPKLLIIRTPSPSGYATTIGVTFVYGIDYQFNDIVAMSESGCYVSWEGNTVTWYAEKQAGDQSNNSGTKYYYVAIG